MSDAFEVAWTLLKSDIMHKENVIGMQDGTQYTMPPAIASMAQRPQQPEMMTQQMEVQQQQPGFFGRFKQPTTEMRTTQVPTGANVVGRRPGYFANVNAGPIQTNSPHPLGAIAADPAPGAQVTRMPRPGPFPEGYSSNASRMPSFSNYQGHYSNGAHLSGFDGRGTIGTRPANILDLPYHGTRGNIHSDEGGLERNSGQIQQEYYGDQFGPKRSFN